MEYLEALKTFHKIQTQNKNIEGVIKLKFDNLKNYIKFKNFLSTINLICMERIDQTKEKSLILEIELSQLIKVHFSKLEVNIDLIQSEMRF